MNARGNHNCIFSITIIRIALLTAFYFAILNSATAKNPNSNLIEQNYCTELADLNQTTRHYHLLIVDSILGTDRYPEYKEPLGIDSEIDLQYLELLTNEKDSAICDRIRERIFGNEPQAYQWDMEKQLYFPSPYLMVYRGPSGQLIAFIENYYRGKESGEVAPPNRMGWTRVIIYDENLNTVIDYNL